MKKGIPFTSDGVYITLPIKFFHLRARKLKKVAKHPKKASEIAINFEIYDPTKKNKKESEFDEPFELRVKYTAAQANNANGAANLILKYHDGSKWNAFKNLQIISHGNGKRGWGVVEISDWDPQVAWFP